MTGKWEAVVYDRTGRLLIDSEVEAWFNTFGAANVSEPAVLAVVTGTASPELDPLRVGRRAPTEHQALDLLYKLENFHLDPVGGKLRWDQAKEFAAARNEMTDSDSRAAARIEARNIADARRDDWAAG